MTNSDQVEVLLSGQYLIHFAQRVYIYIPLHRRNHQNKGFVIAFISSIGLEDLGLDPSSLSALSWTCDLMKKYNSYVVKV